MQSSSKPSENSASHATQVPSTTPPQAVPPSLPLTPRAEQEILPVVIIDPGHGGADTGARGPSGVQEKDITIAWAAALRAECEHEGFRAVLTRDGDQDPSFDDRAGIANAHHYAIFISLHVSSTGRSGTVRTYVYPAVEKYEGSSDGSSSVDSQTGGAGKKVVGGLVEWDRAQQPFVADSRKLGDLIQVELSQKFSDSPELSTAARARDLRSIAMPAVAVEVSSVDVPDVQAFRQVIPAMAAAIARGVSGFAGHGKQQ